jgi:hypothetical protein
MKGTDLVNYFSGVTFGEANLVMLRGHKQGFWALRQELLNSVTAPTGEDIQPSASLPPSSALPTHSELALPGVGGDTILMPTPLPPQPRSKSKVKSGRRKSRKSEVADQGGLSELGALSRAVRVEIDRVPVAPVSGSSSSSARGRVKKKRPPGRPRKKQEVPKQFRKKLKK